MTSAYELVAIADRSGLDEAAYSGAIVALNSDGTIAFAVGDPAQIIYPRSCNKPMQAVAMLRSGLSLAPSLLALACGSHAGAPAHTAGAAAILRDCGLSAAALGNTATLPLDPVEAAAVLRAGSGPSALQMCCSGKHAAMVATCVRNRWEIESYLAVDHPLQQAVTAVIDELAGERHAHVGVDGCGAPAHAMSLLGLARAYRLIAIGAAGTDGTQVYAAITKHPEMVGGERLDSTAFMRAVPGLMAKDGGLDVFAGALPDGRAIAVKMAAPSAEARPPVFAAALRRLGVDLDIDAFVPPVLGHGRPVGRIRAAFG